MAKPKKKIEVGQRFYNATVIKELKPKSYYYGYYFMEVRYFLLKCDCGNEFIKSLPSIQATKKAHCGCLRKHRITQPMGPKPIELKSGDVIYSYRIIEELEPKFYANGKKARRFRVVHIPTGKEKVMNYSSLFTEKYRESHKPDLNGVNG